MIESFSIVVLVFVMNYYEFMWMNSFPVTVAVTVTAIFHRAVHVWQHSMGFRRESNLNNNSDQLNTIMYPVAAYFCAFQIEVHRFVRNAYFSNVSTFRNAAYNFSNSLSKSYSKSGICPQSRVLIVLQSISKVIFVP